MEKEAPLNLKELIGKNALDAYDAYIKLTQYSNLINDIQNDFLFCDDYKLRNYNFPLGIYVKGNE